MPGRERDGELGEHVAQACRELAGDEVYADLRAETATRRILAGEGWTLDPEPWVALHADLDRWTPTVSLDDAAVVEAADAVADRVAVQRAGFENSTLHRGRLAPDGRRPRLPARPRPRAWSATGSPVSIATAWWAGEGATAILEPVATHRDHRGRGWGVRAVTALVAPAARPRRLGSHGLHAPRLRRRGRDLPRRRPPPGRAHPVDHPSVHRVGLGDPPRGHRS